MQYFFKHLPEIKRKLGKAPGFVLMLDFDGTLSPIAPTPGQAVLPKSVKKQLQKCSRFFPVAIISGRSLFDIKQKVGLKNLVYAGNHGLEWQVGKKISFAPGAKQAAKPLKAMVKELKKLEQMYKGSMINDKRLSLSLHYRLLSPNSSAKFKRAAMTIIKPLAAGHNIQIFHGKKTIELRPDINWNKGKFALYLLKHFEGKFKRRLLPVYIGDDTTDEDAFRLLRPGLTIRVGQNRTSRAAYSIRNPGQIRPLIKWLCASSIKKSQVIGTLRKP